MTWSPRWRATLSACALLAAAAQAGPAAPPSDEPISPLPQQADVPPARAALGQRLFHDTRLSRDQHMSCATCHPIDRAGMDGRPLTATALRPQVQRNTPTVYNAAFNMAYNWDGSARSLEAQARNVIIGLKQFNNTLPQVLATLGADSSYRRDFQAAYPDGLTEANLLNAIASYERTLITPNARFDQYLRGNRQALNSLALEGYGLFKSFGCAACHQGMNVGGNLFQRFGVFSPGKPADAALAANSTSSANHSADLGRFWVTQDPRDREVFRVPSLRNVALTPPYFHDGGAATLAEAVRVMARVQLDRRLTEHETEALVAFLHTLTGQYQGQPLRNAALGATP